ncbi:helix-turn-helix transcriptional regulator, partial [Streptomyces sp. NPDC005568]
MGGDGFAELLRELKERSGLSYGVLGKRLHVSASTLHRYVNGDAVPADYAPVERLARICRATPEELVELHRRWVLADALRGRKEKGTAAGSPGAGGSGAGAARSSGPDAGAARPSAAGAVGSSGVDAPRPSVAEEAESGSADPNPDPDPDPTSPSGVVAETGPGAVPEPGARRRRRTVV